MLSDELKEAIRAAKLSPYDLKELSTFCLDIGSQTYTIKFNGKFHGYRESRMEDIIASLRGRLCRKKTWKYYLKEVMKKAFKNAGISEPTNIPIDDIHIELEPRDSEEKENEFTGTVTWTSLATDYLTLDLLISKIQDVTEIGFYDEFSHYSQVEFELYELVRE